MEIIYWILTIARVIPAGIIAYMSMSVVIYSELRIAGYSDTELWKRLTSGDRQTCIALATDVAVTVHNIFGKQLSPIILRGQLIFPVVLFIVLLWT